MSELLMQKYAGTMQVWAKEMTRAEYNDYRGWVLPDDEDGSDEGYLIEEISDAPANFKLHKGPICWKTKEQFKASFKEVTKDGINNELNEQLRSIDNGSGFVVQSSKCRICNYKAVGIFPGNTPPDILNNNECGNCHNMSMQEDEMDE